MTEDRGRQVAGRRVGPWERRSVLRGRQAAGSCSGRIQPQGVAEDTPREEVAVHNYERSAVGFPDVLCGE